jgi:hypothetical protein
MKVVMMKTMMMMMMMMMMVITGLSKIHENSSPFSQCGFTVT